ncbi:MAG TPA: hypothetical protein VKB80_19145 [Kofleriaceae bacterium]|nr:hypothetical protein [Kofleriaceae bacterium]
MSKLVTGDGRTHVESPSIRTEPAARRLVLALLLAASAGAAAACSKSGSEGAVGSPVVHIAISIDWEGAYFRTEALDAVDRFRRDNPGVPLTHMLNAAYYTKADADPTEATREIRLAVKKGDETGLHIHCWKSLLEASGVKMRAVPSFLGSEGGMVIEGDPGFDLDLSAFTVAEVRAVMKKSRQILDAEHIAVGPSFRAGGWIGTPGVLEAARAEGFTIDSSATDPAWLDEPEGRALQARLRQVWSRVDQTTQPFWIDTPAGRILEMPDTGAMADYLTVPEIQAHVERAVAAVRAAPGRPVFVHLGFHAETADDFAPRVSQALSVLRARKTPMVFETMSRSAELARRALEAQAR